MKNLKTFESFSYQETNEKIKSKVRKFFKGHESKEDYEKAKSKFEKELEKVEKKVEKNEDKYSFNKKSLEKQAKGNSYLGKLVERKGGRNKDTTYVVYEKGTTKAKEFAKGAGDALRS